ncbi:hypothetical protein [Paraburkholderia sp. MM5477-R1]|uniref:hypothetical protein n=1 Tax=Paraburkholderia sp. MM5477-R1 TaxID=2991062 RepID=UPI003D25734B
MDEIKNLQQQVAQLNGHVSALAAFATALLRSMPAATKADVLQHFEGECENLLVAMLGASGDETEHQIGALTLVRETLQRVGAQPPVQAESHDPDD